MNGNSGCVGVRFQNVITVVYESDVFLNVADAVGKTNAFGVGMIGLCRSLLNPTDTGYLCRMGGIKSLHLSIITTFVIRTNNSSAVKYLS